MQVTRRVLPAATTELSSDGKAIVVHRFDVDSNGQPHWGMEDFCALLGLRPAAKYDTTWERIAKGVRDHVPGPNQVETFRRLATLLILTYAIRNSDCHAKNISLLYTTRQDVQLAPVYDMITTTIYAGYQHNPPGISFMGRKTWTPGKSLPRFIAGTFGIPPKIQAEIIEEVSDAISDVATEVRAAMDKHEAFEEIGARMLLTWNAGVAGLRDRRVFSLETWNPGPAFAGFSEPPKLDNPKRVIGRSEGLARRRGAPKSN